MIQDIIDAPSGNRRVPSEYRLWVNALVGFVCPWRKRTKVSFLGDMLLLSIQSFFAETQFFWRSVNQVITAYDYLVGRHGKACK